MDCLADSRGRNVSEPGRRIAAQERWKGQRRAGARVCRAQCAGHSGGYKGKHHTSASDVLPHLHAPPHITSFHSPSALTCITTFRILIGRLHRSVDSDLPRTMTGHLRFTMTSWDLFYQTGRLSTQGSAGTGNPRISRQRASRVGLLGRG